MQIKSLSFHKLIFVCVGRFCYSYLYIPLKVLNIVLSLLFSNIVLHELDEFIDKELKKEFTKGEKRKANLEYRKLRYRIKRENDLKKRRVLIKNCGKVPSKDFHDLNFKRLFYVRYVNDWVILVAGSLEETKVIRNKVSDKLQSLCLNMEKTHITLLT